MSKNNNSPFLVKRIYDWLKDNHPDVMEEMLEKLDGEWSPTATQTVNQTLRQNYKMHNE